MSVVEKVAKVDLDPARDQALARLEAAQNVLESSSSSEAAKRKARTAQLTELVELNRFADIARIAKSEDVTTPEHVITVAYALYRLGRLTEIREYVTETAPVGAQLALAQAEYKSGNLDKARSLLEKNRASVDENDSADISVNLSAINALKGTSIDTSGLSAFDANFNTGCYWLSRGQLDKALATLQTTLGSAEEEDDRQSAIVQAGVVHMLKGETEQAKQLFQQISTDHEALSNSLALVLKNNLASLAYDGSLVSAHEALKAYDDLHLHAPEVNAGQREVLYRNLLKLQARVGIHGISKKAQKFRETFTADFEPEVAALTYTKTPKQIRKLAATEESEAVKLWLSAVTGTNLVAEPTDLVAGDFGSLLVAVKQLEQGNTAGVSEYFKSLSPQLAEAGLALLNPSDSKLDQESIDSLLGEIDASALDAEGIPATLTETPSSASALTSSKKRKRSGKPKLPASYDPEKQPDPERWLAKEDRSDYKPKKAKKTQATQGFAGETAEVHVASTSQVVGAKTKNKKKKGRK